MAREVFSHGLKHFGEHFVAQTIEDLVSFLAREDEPAASEEAEVLRQVRLLDRDGLKEAADGVLALGELFDDVNPRRVGEDLEHPGFEAAEGVVVHTS